MLPAGYRCTCVPMRIKVHKFTSTNAHQSAKKNCAPMLTNTSQVPQPTCYWKWVGVSMPQKVGHFSLRPSSTAIWRCSRLSGGLLSSYRSQVALTPALEFYIHPVLLQPGIHVTLPILTSSPSQSSFRFHRFFYLYFPFPPS